MNNPTPKKIVFPDTTRDTPYTEDDLPTLRSQVADMRRALDSAWNWLEENADHPKYDVAYARFDNHLHSYEITCRVIRMLDRQLNRKIGNI